MANKDIFGLPEKKKKALEATASGMASEYGEELVGRKIASGEIAKDAGKAVAKSVVKAGKPHLGGEDDPNRATFEKTKQRNNEPVPNTETKPEPAPEKKTFGDGFRDGLKQAFKDPFGIGALQKNMKKKEE